MASSPYPIPGQLRPIPPALLDLRPDPDIDHQLLQPEPVSGDKNIWFFWHGGFSRMHPYSKRTVRTWHRRFSKLGWTVRVLDREPGSPSNVANFLDIHDRSLFPEAFARGIIDGHYAPQHTSDLVRWPLLITYGGVYADVGLIQIGDLDRAWNETVANPDSPYQLLTFHFGGPQDRALTNYFFASGRQNPLFLRCHKLLLALWAADGGKTNTEGMHASPLLRGIPLMGRDLSFEEDGRVIEPAEASRLLTDYIIQGHVISMVLGLVDEDDGWDGPRYAAEHVYAIDYIVGSQLINEMTAWNGRRQFDLLSLSLPAPGEPESEDQREARLIVEACLERSFAFKLAHGIITRVMGDTLGSLWRKHEGADDVPGTYGHWLRHGTLYWNQPGLPPRVDYHPLPPRKVGPLLREADASPHSATAP